MVKVVICNGFPESGKSTFQENCKEICNYWNYVPGFTKGHTLQIKSYSTIDFVKEIAFDCGWSGKKTQKNRKFLSDLKDLLTEWNDIPFKKTCNFVQSTACSGGDWIIFIDCREPEEIERLKKELNATTLLIRRESIENNEASNHADANVFNYQYDLTIWNNFDKIVFKEQAKKFIDYMKKEGVPCYELRND